MSTKPPILLMPQGSAGDVHPFIGLGLALRRRGYAVTLATNGHFAALAQKVDIPFVEIGTAEQFEAVTSNPDLWKPSLASTRLVFGMSAKVLPKQYETIRAMFEQDNRLVVVAGPLAFGARVASEKLGVKHVTVQLSPSVFLSCDKPPRLPGLVMPTWLPHALKQGMWNLAMSMVDRVACPPINAYRREVGLSKPMERTLTWWNAPLLTVAMFPSWFAKPADDWPSQVKLSGFGLYDEANVEPLSDEVMSFLNAGSPPVVFTPGSANAHGRSFFEASVKACQLSGRRGILLSRYPANIPADLPPGVRHFAYVPLSQLLGHCAALVYHGGIGTLSQACKAGVPHLVRKLSHDQFDNALRLERLGIGRSCKPSGYKAHRVARMLDELIDSPDVQDNCRQIAEQMRSENGVSRACDLIEQII